MTREEAIKLVNEIFDAKENLNQHTMVDEAAELAIPRDEPEEEKKRELPEGQRVVRTSNTGDRVYLLDDNTKLRHWLQNPTALENAGFQMGDVVEVEDTEMLKYQMGPPKY